MRTLNVKLKSDIKNKLATNIAGLTCFPCTTYIMDGVCCVKSISIIMLVLYSNCWTWDVSLEIRINFDSIQQTRYFGIVRVANRWCVDAVMIWVNEVTHSHYRHTHQLTKLIDLIESSDEISGVRIWFRDWFKCTYQLADTIFVQQNLSNFLTYSVAQIKMKSNHLVVLSSS